MCLGSVLAPGPFEGCGAAEDAEEACGGLLVAGGYGAPLLYPLGHIQMVGKSDGMQIEAEGLPSFLHWLPEKPFDWIARHPIDFWLISEGSVAKSRMQ